MVRKKKTIEQKSEHCFEGVYLSWKISNITDFQTLP